MAWQFHKKGLLVTEAPSLDEDRLLGIVLEAGAEDVKKSGSGFEITTEISEFEAVKAALQQAGIQTSVAEMTYLSQNQIQLEEKPAEQMLKLMEILDDHDDVQKVHANFDIPDEVMEKVAASG